MAYLSIKNYSLKLDQGHSFIQNLNLDLEKGEVLGIVGKSGIGKTVLGLSLGGFIQAGIISSGSIEKEKKNLKLSILFQNPLSQIFSTKVYDELKNSLHLSQQSIDEDYIHHIAKEWDILHILHKRIDKLSLGEAQRVAIASMMIAKPDLIILDEPFQYVDNIKFKANIDQIKKQNKDILIFIIEHNYHMLNQVADRILTLNKDGHSIDTTVDYPKPKPRMFDKRRAEQKSLDVQLRLQNLCFAYQDCKVLSDFSYQLEHAFFIIDGNNGAGKSTLAKLIARLLKQQKGDVEFDFHGKQFKNPKLKHIREEIGYIFQNPDYQIFSNTVEEEIFYGVKVTDEVQAYVEGWLKKFQLEGLLHHSPHTLSYGERRRLNILSATVHQPKLIIYDEPTVGLDYENRSILLDFMEEQHQKGVVQLLISHDRWFKEQIQGDIARMTL